MSAALTRRAAVVSWTCQVAAASILAQTLFFKFTGAPESVHVFAALGMEPWGRLGTGVAELATVALLLRGGTAWLGALVGAGLMCGAIGAHLTRLGIVVLDDGGLLFALACVTLACSVAVLALRRDAVREAARAAASLLRPASRVAGGGPRRA